MRAGFGEIAPVEEGSFETREAVETRRRATLLVCPDNDPESHMILLLAEKAGMATHRSNQRHGATLDQEPDVVEEVVAAGKPNLWVVEMPGPGIEEELRRRSVVVEVIDHHEYRGLDRTHDPKTGDRLPSSLEQFLRAASITDEEIQAWGYEPKIVRGIGIMDERFVGGLREAGYSKEEIGKVLDVTEQFSRQGNPRFDVIRDAARADWARKELFGPYILIRSKYERDVRGAIAFLSIREGVDMQPMIISSQKGEKIYVQNVSPSVVQHLMKAIDGKTFSYGSGRCWGVDNTGQKRRVILDQVLAALRDAPPPVEEGR